MSLKAKEFDRIAKKLDLKTRNSGDKLAWFEHDGKVITRTKRSHGSGDLPAADQIRQQLKVNEQQMRGLVDCSFSRDDYVQHLTSKGLI